MWEEAPLLEFIPEGVRELSIKAGKSVRTDGHELGPCFCASAPVWMRPSETEMPRSAHQQCCVQTGHRLLTSDSKPALGHWPCPVAEGRRSIASQCFLMRTFDC